MDDKRCPPWHYLPGPYGLDPAVKECPNADTHKEQRKAHDERNKRNQ